MKHHPEHRQCTDGLDPHKNQNMSVCFCHPPSFHHIWNVQTFIYSIICDLTLIRSRFSRTSMTAPLSLPPPPLDVGGSPDPGRHGDRCVSAQEAGIWAISDLDRLSLFLSCSHFENNQAAFCTLVITVREPQTADLSQTLACNFYQKMPKLQWQIDASIPRVFPSGKHFPEYSWFSSLIADPDQTWPQKSKPHEW